MASLIPVSGLRPIAALIGLLTLAPLPAALAQTDHSGTCSGTFSPAGNPHRLTSTCTVPAGMTLTLEPGVVLQAASGTQTLNVDGTLDSGAGGNPVTIQDVFVNFRNGSAGTVQNTEITGVSARINVTGSGVAPPTAPTITNCTITSGTIAIDLFNLAQPTITNNVITTNSVGIRFNQSASGTVMGNTISFDPNAGGNRIGIDVNSTAAPVIDGNTILDDPLRSDTGIDLQSAGLDAPIVVTNNTIHVSGTDEPLIVDVSIFDLTADVTISGNTFPDGLAAGLRIGFGTIATDSQIDPINGISAFGLDGDVQIQNATLTIPSGIVLSGGRTLRVQGGGLLNATNVVFQDVIFDYQVGSGGTVQGSTFMGNSRFTIRGDSIDDPASPIITANDIDVGSVTFFDVQNTAEPMITNNVVRVNGTAFFYRNASAGRAEGNTITFPSGEGNSRVAFNVDSSASPILNDNAILDDPTRNDIGFDLTNLLATSSVVITNNEIHVTGDDQPFVFGVGVFLLAAGATIDGNLLPDGIGGGARIAFGTFDAEARIAPIDGISAYRLNGDVLVGAGQLLTIESGIALSTRTIRVDGTLNAAAVIFEAMAIEYRVGSGGTLQDSTLADSAIRFIGTSVDTPAAPMISGNMITGAGFGTLVDINDTARPVIVGNTLTGNGTLILARGSSGGEITDNVFAFISGVSSNRIALNVDGAASPTVTGNEFRDDPTRDDFLVDLAGLTPASTVTVSGNSLCATGGDRPFLFGAGFFATAMNATVENNDLVCGVGGGVRLASDRFEVDAQLREVNGASSFTIEGTLTVGTGVILTIPAALRIQGVGRTVIVDGTLNAEGVELAGPFVDFRAGSAGSIEGSSFMAGARARVTDASPSFVGNLFTNADPAIELAGQTNVEISENTFIDNGVAIQVNVSTAESNASDNVFEGNTHAYSLLNAGALFSALPNLDPNEFLGTSEENSILLPTNIDASGTIASQPVAYRAPTLTIAQGSTVTIDPGVALQCNDFSSVIVNGRIVAEGFADLPIVFTAFQAKQGRRWRGLQINNQGGASASVLSNFIVEFAGRNGEAGIRLDNADVSITDCVVADNLFDGIRAQNGSNPTITGCAIANNLRHGVSVSADSSPLINFNSIFGNVQSGVTVDACPDPSALVDAANNFWGDDSGPFDNSDDTPDGGLFNPLGQGDAVSNCVGYAPFTSLGPSIEGRIVLVSGQGQTGTPGEILPQPLVVEIQNLDGQPLEGIAVTFTVVEGDASIVDEQPIATGGDGRAAASVQLGNTPGDILVAVTAVDVNSPLATFIAEGGSALFALAATAPPDWVCPGDCDGAGGVSVGELMLGVNIALGRLPLAECPAMDHGADGSVDVEDLIEAVAMSLGTCAEAQ